jgi:hypothetical protein
MVMFNRTLAPIRRHNKRQDRLKAKAAVVIDAMFCGQVLHRHNAWYGSIWWLSRDGTRVPDEIAQIIIKNPAVVGDGDALPLNSEVLSQSYRIGAMSND